ncbi:MAG: hypothetical protein WC538_15555 [Thermoanaerobaculia bacterium]|jgi:hypothetical protein
MRTRNFFIILTIALAVAVSASAKDVIERYQAFAVSMGTVATGARSTVQMGIFRWSTEEEIANFQNILKTEGPAKLNEAFFKSEQVAFLKVGGSMGYKLQFARKFNNPDGSTRIVLVAERPIGFVEGARNSRTKDYDFSIIELSVPADGKKGTGALAIGVEVKWDAAKNQLILENYSSEPVRLMEVAKTSK